MEVDGSVVMGGLLASGALLALGALLVLDAHFHGFAEHGETIIT